MIRILLTLLGLAALLAPRPALAWGEYGHRTTAAIAARVRGVTLAIAIAAVVR